MAKDGAGKISKSLRIHILPRKDRGTPIMECARRIPLSRALCLFQMNLCMIRPLNWYGQRKQKQGKEYNYLMQVFVVVPIKLTIFSEKVNRDPVYYSCYSPSMFLVANGLQVCFHLKKHYIDINTIVFRLLALLVITSFIHFMDIGKQ